MLHYQENRRIKPMELLNVSHLCKTYGTAPAQVEALKNADFTMQKSEFTDRKSVV